MTIEDWEEFVTEHRLSLCATAGFSEDGICPTYQTENSTDGLTGHCPEEAELSGLLELQTSQDEQAKDSIQDTDK